LAFSLTQKNLKDSFSKVLKAFKPISIWGPLVIGILWISLLLFLLNRLKIWDWSNLKTAVVWTLTFAFYSMLQANKIEFDKNYRHHLTIESFGLAAILMFIGSVYTLPLWAEFLIVPFAVFLTALQAVSATKSEFAIVTKFATQVLSFIGISYITYWSYRIYQAPDKLFTLANFTDFMLPIILTIWYLPFLFLWKLVMIYELLFVSLKRNIEETKLLRFAKIMAVLNLKWSLKAIDYFKKRIAVRSLTNKYEVVKELHWVKLVGLKEKYLTEDSHLGWAPKNAMWFLADDGLEIKNYTEPFDNDWHGSATKKLKSGSLFGTLKYSIDGKETHIVAIRLVMSFWEVDNLLESEAEFIDLCARLMMFASKALPVEFIDRLSKLEAFNGAYSSIAYNFNISRSELPNHTISDYILELKIVEAEVAHTDESMTEQYIKMRLPERSEVVLKLPTKK